MVKSPWKKRQQNPMDQTSLRGLFAHGPPVVLGVRKTIGKPWEHDDLTNEIPWFSWMADL